MLVEDHRRLGEQGAQPRGDQGWARVLVRRQQQLDPGRPIERGPHSGRAHRREARVEVAPGLAREQPREQLVVEAREVRQEAIGLAQLEETGALRGRERDLGPGTIGARASRPSRWLARSTASRARVPSVTSALRKP
jgi:hypothetical protein